MDARRVDMMGRCALALGAAAFVLLLFHRGVRPVLQARAQLGSFHEAARILTDAQGALDHLNAEVDRLRSDVAADEARLPPAADLDRFLERLEASARETRIRVETLTPQPIRDRGLFREQQVDVRVTGSFPRIYSLLDRLESSGPLSRVEQLSISGPAEGGECAADLRLALYFAPSGKEPS